ncbi:mucin-2-like [Homarus americanus]|uniref:mucin-2-like n=1 Tax=Homarus americanus TaxID=6706 RepID=UPI001C440B93|nr:mucin-2-like [Homarus americanus]
MRPNNREITTTSTPSPTTATPSPTTQTSSSTTSTPSPTTSTSSSTTSTPSPTTATPSPTTSTSSSTTSTYLQPRRPLSNHVDFIVNLSHTNNDNHHKNCPDIPKRHVDDVFPNNLRCNYDGNDSYDRYNFRH